jgi:hypothetical protein
MAGLVSSTSKIPPGPYLSFEKYRDCPALTFPHRTGFAQLPMLHKSQKDHPEVACGIKLP